LEVKDSKNAGDIEMRDEASPSQFVPGSSSA